MSSDTVITSQKEKIDELNRQAWEARVSDSQKAFELSEQTVKLSREINYTKGLAEGLCSLGFAYVRLFKNDEAAPLLRESLSLFQSMNDLKGQAIVYEYLGIIERNWGNLGHSLELLLKGNDLIRQVGDIEIEITSSYQIGVTYKHLGDHDNALDYLYQSLSLAKKIDMVLMVAYATNIIGSIYFDNGNYEKALDLYQQGLVIRRQSHDKWGEAGSLDNIGFTYLKLNDLDKAIDYCKQSLAISKATGDKKGEANALLHLAEIYEQANDVANASRFSNESLEIRKARGDKRGEAEVLLFLAGLHKNHNVVEEQKVFEWLSGALKIADEIKAQDLLSKAFYDLHEFYIQKGDFKKSLAQLESHLHIEKELHKNAISQKVSNLEVTHKAEIISQRNKELTELNEQIGKANAELKIESSLERVRSRSMGMQKSDELKQVIRVIYDQFSHLNINVDHAGFVVDYKPKGDWNFWIADKQVIPSKITHPYFDSVWANQFNEAKENGKDFFATNLDFEEKNKFYNELLSFVPDLPEESRNFYLTCPGLAISTVLMDNVALYIENFSGIPYTNEENEMLMRFGKVFEQAYTRFLDLQKAERQAREAQIETGLERVRSRTMAMHKSEEVTDVAVSLNEELLKLGFAGGSTIIIIDPESGDTDQWTGFSENKSLQSCYVPCFDHPFHHALLRAWKKKDPFLVYTLAGKEKKTLDEHYFSTGYKDFPESDKKWMRAMEHVTFSHAFMKYGAIHWGPHHLTEEQLKILQRFAKVFEQSYTRFLDLKKAEAQAREAQIQLSLERVRAKSMAMYHSDELNDVLSVLFAQFDTLGIKPVFVHLSLFDLEKNLTTLRITGKGGQRSMAQKTVAIDAMEEWKEELANWKASKPSSISRIYYPKEVLPQIWDLFGDLFDQLPDDSKIFPDDFQNGLYCIQGNTGFGYIGLNHTREATEEEKDIINRFAIEFGRVYQRFLDLKKAEAQAREAEIQLALERVRARSLAMHHTSELQDVVNIVAQQLHNMNIDINGGVFITINDEVDQDLRLWASGGAADYVQKVTVPYLDEPVFKLLRDAIKRRNNFFTEEHGYDDKIKLFKHLFNYSPWKDLSAQRKQELLSREGGYARSVAVSNHTSIAITNHNGKKFSGDDNEVLKRFGNVFEQSYIRFLDLQKAETQAREAQIELALERVRAKAMAMQQPAEFVDVINVIGEQFIHLDFDIEWVNFGANGLDIANGIDAWNFAVIPGGQHISSRLFIPRFDHPLFTDADKYMAEYRKTGSDLFVIAFGKEDKDRWLDQMFGNTIFRDVPGEYREIQYAKPGYTTSNLALKDTFLSIGKFDTRSFTDEQHAILKRFGNAFGQAYTRFLDLQKAEAQAREALIEAALERVRSRSMAMHKSDELREVVAVLFAQLQHIGFDIKFCSIALIDKVNSTVEFWLSGFSQEILPESYHVPNLDHPFYHNFQNTFRQGVPYKVFQLGGDEKKSYDELWFKLTDFRNLPDPVKRPMMEMDKVVLSCAFTKNGMIQIGGFEALSDTDAQILQRFAKVFEQTHTRFLDLQKAEAQAREARIEAALERARTQSMIMQHSTELDETLRVFHEQVLLLGIRSQFSFLWLPDENKDRHIFWATWVENNSNSFKSKAIDYPLDRNEPATMQCLVDWKSGQPVVSYNVPPEAVQDYFAVWQELIAGVEHLKPGHFNQGLNYVEAFMKYGCFGVMVENELEKDEKKILGRFAIEFERAYTRFLDLQKAEAQAREAQIEAALEKVRAKVMAMKTSNDLNETSLVFGEQLRKLGIAWQFSYFWLIEDGKDENVFWITWPDHKTSTTTYSWAEADETFRECLMAWQEQTKIHATHVPVEDVPAWLATFERITIDAGGTAIDIMKPENFKEGVYYYDAMIRYGSFGILINRSTNKEEQNIQVRFATEFERAYTRFLDLQKAEAQTREALIEGALERVRARALAMQQPEELKDVAQVLRNEMGALGIEELETCSIYIHEKDSETAECWYALKDQKDAGKTMVADHFHLELNDTWVGTEMKKFYSSDEKQTSIVMQGVNRKEWIDYCYKRSPVFSGFYGETIPDRTYHLYKFSHGYIGAAAPGDISAESWRLLSRAASVFSLAYSRFRDLTQARNDLVKLKEEKKRAEDALAELQNTQRQLIQTEKMASLGELTAGIAHEIQNPLNFVNNFSDVSNELIEEMKEELQSGNTDQAIQIINDVKDNLEKILHHGKRADAIVKGMLQHSRSSSGVKEPTDINNLADEYLRLAFHGYRAKDKSFNAKFETNFDNSIERINVIPQDVGRVILNLINNAFYTVNEKRKHVGNGYEPTVIVSTKKVNEKIEISVKDNGDGIPQKVLDKIFQPFFTTKPTGQGTGLGLSLSYDIVKKGHGGDIKVETKDGEGAEFIISLPIN